MTWENPAGDGRQKYFLGNKISSLYRTATIYRRAIRDLRPRAAEMPTAPRR